MEQGIELNITVEMRQPQAGGYLTLRESLMLPSALSLIEAAALLSKLHEFVVDMRKATS